MRFFVDGSITTPTTEYLTNPKYQQVEYLESTGTQYINTGYSANLNSLIEYHFNLTELPDSSALFGSGSSTTSNDRFQGYYESSLSFSTKLSSTTTYSNVKLTAGTKHYSKMGIPLAGYYIDDTFVSSAVGTPTNYNLYIFARNIANSANQPIKMKLYDFRVSENNALIRNMIPAIRKEDGKPGMYDKVSGQFFTNAGTGEFLYGNPVYSNVPRGYKECEYLESTGTQYIDTGVTGNNNIKVQTNIYPTVINKFIFGSRVSSATNAFGLFMHSNNGGSWYPFFSDSKSMIPGFAIDSDYTIEFSKDGLIVNGTLLQGPYDTTFTNALTMKLFAIDTNGTVDNRMFIGKIYYCKILDNGVLVRNFIPVLREADNEPGMYDRVSNTFFTNKGTGTFTYKLKERQTEKVTRILYSGSKMRLVRNTAA